MKESNKPTYHLNLRFYTPEIKEEINKIIETEGFLNKNEFITKLIEERININRINEIDKKSSSLNNLINYPFFHFIIGFFFVIIYLFILIQFGFYFWNVDLKYFSIFSYLLLLYISIPICRKIYSKSQYNKVTKNFENIYNEIIETKPKDLLKKIKTKYGFLYKIRRKYRSKILEGKLVPDILTKKEVESLDLPYFYFLIIERS